MGKMPRRIAINEITGLVYVEQPHATLRELREVDRVDRVLQYFQSSGHLCTRTNPCKASVWLSATEMLNFT